MVVGRLRRKGAAVKFLVKMRGGSEAPISKVVDADDTFNALDSGLIVFTKGNHLVLAVGTASLISIEPQP